MYTIALVNQKGGVGKSTTAVNLSAGLAKLGQRVLLIDLDPQAHATVALGLDPKKCPATIYSLLSGAAKPRDVIRPINERLSIIPSTVNLAGGEAELTWQQNPHFILKNAMAELGDSEFDYCIVDSPPQLGFLNVNSLAWVKHVMIPVLCEFYALHGLSLLIDTVERVKAKLNPDLAISGVIACQYNARRALTREVLADLEKNLPGRVLKTRIRVNVRLAEAPSHGMSVHDYAPESNGAKDYLNLAREVFERMTGQQAPEPVVAAVEPAAAVEIEPPPPGGWGPNWSPALVDSESQVVAETAAPETAPERPPVDPLADVMTPDAAPAPAEAATTVVEAAVEDAAPVAEVPAEPVAATEAPSEAVIASAEAVVASPEAVVASPEVVVASPEAVIASSEAVVASSDAVVVAPPVPAAEPMAAAVEVPAMVDAPPVEAVTVSEEPKPESIARVGIMMEPTVLGLSSPDAVAEGASASDPYATDVASDATSSAPASENPSASEPDAEEAVSSSVAEPEPATATADPYATDVPASAPAPSPEFVVPMPATPITELPNAMPKPQERPAMPGRYAIAGLKPIVTARPPGSVTPLPEKKKGLFGSGLFGKLLKRD